MEHLAEGENMIGPHVIKVDEVTFFFYVYTNLLKLYVMGCNMFTYICIINNIAYNYKHYFCNFIPVSII
jgi:hypothetical protein